MTRKASIKETGEELSQADWARFDAAIARVQAERSPLPPCEGVDTDTEPGAFRERSREDGGKR